MQFANRNGVPFLATSGAHGSITTLGGLNQGMEIWMTNLTSIAVAADGQTATIGGGALSKSVTDALWAAGKQTGEPTVPLYIISLNPIRADIEAQ